MISASLLTLAATSDARRRTIQTAFLDRAAAGRAQPTGPRQIPATAPTEAVRCQRCHRCASIENATYRSPDTPADVNRGFGFSALDHVVHKPNHRLVQFDAESDEDE